MTDETTREAITAQLVTDARIDYGTQLRHLLGRAAQELHTLIVLVDGLPIGQADPIMVLEVLAGLARTKRLERQQGRLDQLLADAQEQAVKLARTGHGVTWRSIGEALGEDGRNTASRFSNIK